MDFESLFSHRNGSPERQAEIRIVTYLSHPASLTPDRIPWNDNQAESLMVQCEYLIAAMRSYRQALAARYAALETSPYTLRLSLIRHPGWRSGVTYDLTLSRIYEDGTEVQELQEHYTGKQRHEALARFEALHRSRPGIETVKAMERQAWERR